MVVLVALLGVRALCVVSGGTGQRNRCVHGDGVEGPQVQRVCGGDGGDGGTRGGCGGAGGAGGSRGVTHALVQCRFKQLVALQLST